VVAENGALLHHPARRETRALGEPPSPRFVEELRARGVSPLSVGRTIVATWVPNETTVLQVIRDLGLEMQVIFNKGAVMVLPSGVNKATGLQSALDDLGLSPHNVVGIGDAENDHAFLRLCECAVAVANALPTVKDDADWVTPGARGDGVCELIDRLVESDLRELSPRLRRHDIPLGTTEDGEEVRVPVQGARLLIAGTSGAGKSTLATSLLEQIAERDYQFCILDPEGDFARFAEAVCLGDEGRVAGVDEVLDVLDRPRQSASLNLLGLKLEDRPAYLDSVLPRVFEMRRRTGRPHWMVMDEAHHMLPPARVGSPIALDEDGSLLLITVHPEQVAQEALALVDAVFAIGRSPRRTLEAFANRVGLAVPAFPDQDLEPGEAIAWWRDPTRPPVRMRSRPPQAERRRHVRKYATGELGPDKSFYFRGPDGRLNLRAQNLTLFLQVADGVDDETWLHHLRQSDYSRWLREAVKDPELADEVAEAERAADRPAAESRAAVRAAIEKRYTAPA
jgi:hypothetical protein